MTETGLEEREIGPLTVLFGDRGGKYPDGNALLVRGGRETAIVDPALGVIPRRDALPRIDHVFNSHCHEDHIAGNWLFRDARWHCHEADAVGFRSLDDFMAIYGLPPDLEAGWCEAVVAQFHYEPHEEVATFADGDRFDFGDVALEVLHTPGHTRGHSCLRFDWAEGSLVYLGDIELSSFGPYYGDAWSDLEDFERSLERIREVEVDWYATFHHIGVVDRATFLERLERFAARIVERETRLLEYLAEPRSLDEIVAHRFVYRPGDAVGIADPVERRSMGLHLARLLEAGAIERDGDRYRVH